jgi:2,4-dienoyl-CoA reductase-like NADH-dependent reductase (Old Yellow Enzyme family)
MYPFFPGLGGAEAMPTEPAPRLLFSHTQLGPLSLPNRVAMAAMVTGFASRAGRPTWRLVEWYAARAAGGAGLIIVEQTLVAAGHGAGSTPSPEHWRRVPRLRLDGDRAIPAFASLAAAIHRGGARAALQLDHPLPPRPIALADALHAFATAAGRARAAGFDAIELACAYDSFLGRRLAPGKSGAAAGLMDGGPAAVRSVVQAVRHALGPALALLVKLGLPWPARDGEIEQLGALVHMLAGLGVDGIEVAAGAQVDSPSLPLSCGVGEATLGDLASAVRQAMAVPVLAGGRLLSVEGAEELLRDGKGDLAVLGRALLADPAWYGKVRAGLDLEIVPCIGCLACYTPSAGGGLGCPVNAEAGREYLPPLEPATHQRRIAILGTSLPALELARIAAMRGHQVELATAGLPLGGLLGLRAGVPGNAELGRAFLYFGDRLRELGAGMGEEVEPGAGVTIDCRPGPERRPAWAHGRGVLLAGELLGRDLHELYGVGRRVVVVGPGALAAEAALFLAGWGRRPVVVVPNPANEPFADVHPMHAARLRERLEGYKVPLVTEATPVAWRYDPNRRSTLRVRRLDGSTEELGPFHSAVSAAGWLPRRAHQANGGGRATSRPAPARWPQRARLPPLPDHVADGTTIVLGDSPYPEPLRDMAGWAHLLARRL